MAALVLFNVTVPARLHVVGEKSPAERTVGTGTKKFEPFAAKVRDFIVENPKCEWISELPFINGKAWWVTFEFSCEAGYEETCLECLYEIGVGDEEDGRGMIHVMPLDFRRIATRPRSCGRPASLPYSAPASPNTTPRSPSLRKTPIIPLGDAIEEGDNESEDKSSNMFESMSGETTVTFIDEEYDDGAEEDNVTARLQAKLIAEVEASEEEKKDMLHKYTENFVETVKSRVAVDALVQYVTTASEFSFDYVMLIVIAAIIACVGLVTNNQVVIVASMLVSPLMGPILAQTLGAVLSDRELMRRGFFAESMGLFFCLLVGFVGGLCSLPVNGDEWPTEEMASRAVVSALYIGVAIAIPSGAGAALSVMGNNTSSLVGVAISASLLPPAVNAGIMFAAAIFYTPGNDMNPYNTTDNPIQGAIISFCLTLINILCIFVAAYGMFEVKEVRGANTFWKTDVANVRKYNKAKREDSSIASIYEKAFQSANRKRSISAESIFSPLERLKASWRRTTTKERNE